MRGVFLTLSLHIKYATQDNLNTPVQKANFHKSDENRFLV